MEDEEFLEKLFSDAYKRETDESENVAGTLPFFATSLALVVTVLGYVAQHLKHVEDFGWRHACYFLLSLASLALAAVLLSLVRAVWPRAYRLLPPETELLAYTHQLKAFYAANGSTDPSADARNSLRSYVVSELAVAVTDNRANNVKRVSARTQAFFSLLAALACAFMLGAVILLSDGVESIGPKGSSADVSTTHHPPSDTAAAVAPGTAQAPLRH